MQHFLTIGMIAATALLCGAQLEAQAARRRPTVYCQPRPACLNGQTTVCQVFGDAKSDCACTHWSQCFGQMRTPPPPPSIPSLQRPIQPRIGVPTNR